MALSISEIVEQTREMPDEQIAELVERVLIARHGESPAGHEKAWAAEVKRRWSEIESGKVETIDGDVVLEELRKITGA